jgi:hypothetical protein
LDCDSVGDPACPEEGGGDAVTAEARVQRAVSAISQDDKSPVVAQASSDDDFPVVLDREPMARIPTGSQVGDRSTALAERSIG